MLDIHWIREDPEAFDRAMESRGSEPAAQRILALDEKRRTHIQTLQEAQSRRNAASKDIGKAKASGDEDSAAALIAEVSELKTFIHEGEEQERALEASLRDALSELPNLPLADVPVGADESANVEVRSHGEPVRMNDAKEHFELGEELGQMRFDIAAKLAGSRFVVLQAGLARMERALGQYMIDLHSQEHGYLEVAPPYLVRDEVMFGTGQLPKFEHDLFKTTDGFWLIPTAEVPLTNYVRNDIMSAADLPVRLTALTPCFRSEAGSAGRDTRGMLRQHQFAKVELVSVTRPEDSLQELDRMTACAEEVLKRLGLSFRTVVLSTGDMGFAAQKTFDIEVWLPGQRAYREISSCSVCGDFQARRMGARFKAEEGSPPQFVHTLNGSGVALGRALIAVMETFQNPDGTITVPEVLRPYMNNIEKIG